MKNIHSMPKTNNHSHVYIPDDTMVVKQDDDSMKLYRLYRRDVPVEILKISFHSCSMGISGKDIWGEDFFCPGGNVTASKGSNGQRSDVWQPISLSRA